MNHGVRGKRLGKVPSRIKKWKEMKVAILNFSHPLTGEQLRQVKDLLPEYDVENVCTVKCQLDHCRSFADQAKELVDAIGWTGQQWQSEAIIVLLPALSAAAGAVLAELHGRCGYFPSIIRLAPIPNTTPPKFAVAEIVNLAQLRDEARARR